MLVIQGAYIWGLIFGILLYLIMHLFTSLYQDLFTDHCILYRLACPRNPSNQMTNWNAIQLPISIEKVLHEPFQNAIQNSPTCFKMGSQTRGATFPDNYL